MADPRPAGCEQERRRRPRPSPRCRTDVRHAPGSGDLDLEKEAGSGCGHQAGRQGRSAGPIPVIEDGCAGQTPCPVRPNSSGSASPIWQRRSARPLPSGSSQQSGGWIEIMEDAVLITPRGKTGGREVEIAPGSSGQTCPVHALGQWRHCARIDVGPLFVAVPATGQWPRANDCPPSTLPGSSGRVPARRTCGQTCRKPSGHVSSPAIPCAPDWPAVPSSTNAMSRKQLGHASAEMTRR